jgi:uncharacterized membrane protein YfcA
VNVTYVSSRHAVISEQMTDVFSEPLAESAFLVAIGIAVGVYATALGAGGAFLLTPFLLLRHPGTRPEFVAMASLAIVAASSGLSSIHALRQRRLDYPVAGVLIAAVVPAASLGAASTSFVPRRAFELGFAVLLLTLAVYIVLPRANTVVASVRGWRRLVADREGHSYFYTFPLWRSLIAAAGAGFLSALAGIGGGPLYTPLAIRVMRIPVELAVPTAHVVITALALAGLGTHLIAGNTGDPLRDAPWLAAGMLAGNPLGQRLNRRLREGPVLRLLAVGMVIVAIRTAIG